MRVRLSPSISHDLKHRLTQRMQRSFRIGGLAWSPAGGGGCWLVWVLVAVAVRLAAPPWNRVAYDGDFEYLPADMSSVAGGRLLDQAFPGERSRSQIVLVLGRG